jgi:hypothetical protein
MANFRNLGFTFFLRVHTPDVYGAQCMKSELRSVVPSYDQWLRSTTTPDRGSVLNQYKTLQFRTEPRSQDSLCTQ